MPETKIYGASDDLIELEGQITEEFNHCDNYGEHVMAILAFSDGTLLEVDYDKDGIWRIKTLAQGDAVITHVSGSVEKDTPVADAFRQASRNGRWGTCGGCPQDTQGNAYPEFCEMRARYDHHLTIEALAKSWRFCVADEERREANGR